TPAPAAIGVPAYSSRREMREAGAYGSRRRDAARGDARGPRRTSGRRVARVREQLARVGVMALIGGLGASLTIPAYANQDPELEETIRPLAAQSLAFDPEDGGASEIARDSYGSTSAAELRRLYADAVRQQ